MSDVGSAYHEHAEMLTTHWWTMDKFREQGEYKECLPMLVTELELSGVACQEGPFSPAETQLMQDAIHKYQMVRVYLLTTCVSLPCLPDKRDQRRRGGGPHLRPFSAGRILGEHWYVTFISPRIV